MSEFSSTKDKYFRLKLKFTDGTITPDESNEMIQLQRKIVELKNERTRKITSDNPETRTGVL